MTSSFSKTFSAEVFEFTELVQLKALLESLAPQQQKAVIRAQPTPHCNLDETIRKQNPSKEVPHPPFEDKETTLLVLDHDNPYPVGSPSLTEDPNDAVRHLIKSSLPKEFHHAKCVYRLGSSAGINPSKFSVHLYFLLNKAITCNDCKNFYKFYGFDSALALSIQPIFTSDPLLEGLEDPFHGRSRVGMIDGHSEVDHKAILNVTVEETSKTSQKEKKKKAKERLVGGHHAPIQQNHTHEKVAEIQKRILSEYTPENRTVFEYALHWVFQQPFAVSGNHGSDQTMRVAAGLKGGFQLNDDDCLAAMKAFNDYSCINLEGQQEKWDEEELEKKHSDVAFDEVRDGKLLERYKTFRYISNYGGHPPSLDPAERAEVRLQMMKEVQDFWNQSNGKAILVQADTGLGKSVCAVRLMTQNQKGIAYLSSRYSALRNAVEEYSRIKLDRGKNYTLNEKDLRVLEEQDELVVIPSPNDEDNFSEFKFKCPHIVDRKHLQADGWSANKTCEDCYKFKEESCPMINAHEKIKRLPPGNSTHVFMHSGHLVRLAGIRNENQTYPFEGRDVIIDEDSTHELLGGCEVSFKDFINHCAEIEGLKRADIAAYQEALHFLKSACVSCRDQEGNLKPTVIKNRIHDQRKDADWIRSLCQDQGENIVGQITNLLSNDNVLFYNDGTVERLVGINPAVGLADETRRILYLDATLDEQITMNAFGKCGLDVLKPLKYQNSECAKVFHLFGNAWGRSKLLEDGDRNKNVELLGYILNSIMINQGYDGGVIITYMNLQEHLTQHCPWLETVNGKYFGGQIVGDDLINDHVKTRGWKNPCLIVVGEPRVDQCSHQLMAYRNGIWKSEEDDSKMGLNFTDAPFHDAGRDWRGIPMMLKESFNYKDRRWDDMMRNQVKRELLQASGRGYPRGLPTLLLNNMALPELPTSTWRGTVQDFLGVNQIQTAKVNKSGFTKSAVLTKLMLAYSEYMSKNDKQPKQTELCMTAALKGTTEHRKLAGMVIKARSGEPRGSGPAERSGKMAERRPA